MTDNGTTTTQKKFTAKRTEEEMDRNNPGTPQADRRQSEEVLLENAERLYTVMDAVKEGITFSDERGHFEAYNTEMERLTGYTMEEANASADFTALIYPDPADRSRALAGLSELTEIGACREIETKIRAKDGREKHVLVSTTLVPYNQRKMFLSNYHDITDRKKTEEKLQESEERFRSLVETTSNWIWETDKNGSFTYASPRIENLLGYSPQEVLGKKFYEFMAPDDAKRIKKTLRDIIRSRQPFYSLESTNLHKNGGPIVLETSGSPIFDKRGNFSGYRGINLNITKRKEAERKLIESEERYRTAIEHSNDGVALVRRDEHIYVNRKFLEIFGYDQPEEVIGKTHSITVHPDDLAMVSEFNRKRQSGQKVASRYEFKGIRKDGTPIYVEVSGTRIVFLGELVTLAYFREITARKQAEEELRKYKEHLEELVRERTTELTMANERLHKEIAERRLAEEKIKILNRELEKRVMDLKAINEGLEAFGYSLSHDLKTPLVAIGGFSKRLLEKYGSRLDEKGQQYLKIINSNITHMEELIRDLLAFFRSGDKTIKYSRLKMDTMVQEIYSQLKSIHQDRSITLIMGDLPEARGDKTMIRQVLANLMNNAIKYSKPREMSLVEVRGLAGESENIYSVKDNGIGFPEEQTSKIFEVFERLHTADEIEGTGLGLAIVKRVIQRHGGQVWAQARVNEGATFFFSIPR